MVTGDIDGSGMIDARWCGAHHPAKTLGVCERAECVVSWRVSLCLDWMDAYARVCVCVSCVQTRPV